MSRSRFQQYCYIGHLHPCILLASCRRILNLAGLVCQALHLDCLQVALEATTFGMVSKNLKWFFKRASLQNVKVVVARARRRTGTSPHALRYRGSNIVNVVTYSICYWLYSFPPFAARQRGPLISLIDTVDATTRDVYLIFKLGYAVSALLAQCACMSYRGP